MRLVTKTKVGRITLAIMLMGASVPAYAQIAADSPATDTGGTIDPFGTLDPFGGTIDPFGGTINPFGGTLNPFGGTLNPFGGTIDPFGGTLDPFRGTLDPFDGSNGITSANLVTFWSQFGTGWQEAKAKLDLLAVAPTDVARQQEFVGKMQTLMTQSDQYWGPHILARTGKSFKEGFADKLFAKYGVSLTDPASFARLTSSDRNKLIFDWYDGLQDFSGKDQVDHWMVTANWNPSITKTQGGGAKSIIGLIDGSVAATTEFSANLKGTTGTTATVKGHGTSVLSLIVSAHDGRGVQGIAPNASVISHTPFDKTGTASWKSVVTGINNLKLKGASVINLSLGVKGWTLGPDLVNVFKDVNVQNHANSTVYVLAAGNSGVRQTTNINLSGTNDAAMLVVGSVDPAGNISSFSNRPGTACLSLTATCATGNRLMDRFMVAPGELLLTSDGNGGLVRVSGTSFAAPLVSGAVTLLHDRWPWLVNHPREAANILLSSARDLGAPGTDEVYGRGLLDVAASQSPINFNALTFYEHTATNSAPVAQSASQVRASAAARSSAWEAEGVFFYLFETHGATHRDFQVPLSTRLIGQRANFVGNNNYFQSFVTGRLKDWMKNGSGFSDVQSITTPSRSGWSLGYDVIAPKVTGLERNAIAQLPSPNLKVAAPNGRFALSLGEGNGVRSIGGQKGFGLASDYDAGNGGVNPILGFASGGPFVKADVALNSKTELALGFTKNRLAAEDNIALSDADRSSLRNTEDYRANALNVRVTHRASNALTMTADYTKMREGNGLLGVQSIQKSDLQRGSATQSATLGATLDMPGKFTLAASATTAVTRAGNADQALRTTNKGVTSTAFAASLTKMGLFRRHDGLRVSISQPLTVESGKLSYTSIGVTDRQTGAIGEVTQSFSIADKSRRLTGELLYSTPVLKSGEVSLFGRADYMINAADNRKVDGLVIGGRVSLPF